MLTNGQMDRAHAPTITVISLVSDADNRSKGSAYVPTFTVVALMPDADNIYIYI